MSNKQPTDYLAQITSAIQALECFSSSSFCNQQEIVPSSNPDSPLVSFDVWTDLEEEVMNYVVDSLRPGNEDFVVECLTDLTECNLLEEQDSTDYLNEARQQVPNMSNLSSRLKPKVVQDPLTDSKGNPLTEHVMLSKEHTFTLTEEEMQNRHKDIHEKFAKHQFDPLEDDADNVVMELEVPARASPMPERINDVETHLEKLSLDLQKEGLGKGMKQDDAAVLGSQVEKCMETLKYSDGLPERSKSIDFVKLNSEGICLKEDDAYINEGSLDSPMSRCGDITPTQTELRDKQGFSPMSISPGSETQIVTPTSKERYINKVWESGEKGFNEILAMALPVPQVSPGTRTNSSTPAISFLGIEKEKIKTEVELLLSWEPLAESACLLEASHRKVSKVEMLIKDENDGHEEKSVVKEIFQLILCRGEDLVVESPPKDTVQEQKSLSNATTSKVSLEVLKYPQIEEMNRPQTIEDEIMFTKKSSNKRPNQKIGDADYATEARANNFTKTPSLQKEECAPSSGLDDFLMLMSTTRNTSRDDTEFMDNLRMHAVKAAKVQPCVSSVLMKSSDDVTEENAMSSRKKQNSEISSPRTKPVPHIVDVRLQCEYEEIVDFLESSIHPFLARLKENGVIQASWYLKDITYDYTRFLVKQMEVSLKQARDREDDIKMQCHRMVVCLHALVGALDLVLNCGLGVALAYLSVIQEKHGDLIGGTLESVRRHLFNAHFKFQQNGVLHPKMSTLLEIIGKWMMGNEKRKDNKTLIITPRYTDLLYRDIREIVSSFGGIGISVFPSMPLSTAKEAIKGHEVVVTSSQSILEDFPWDMFDYVIEYEENGVLRPEIQLRPEAKKRLKEHVVLKVLGEETKCPSEKAKLSSLSIPSQDQYTLIGSTKITNDVDLLHLLEARHNILIYERDYTKLTRSSKESLNKMNLQPDLLIDERTCVVIQDIHGLEYQEGYEKMKDMVLSLSLKCQKCYVMLYTKTGKTNEYALSGNIPRHLSLLFASTAHYVHNKSEFNVEILFSFTAEETARLIREMGDLTRQHCKVWDKEEWIKRKWLTDEMSVHEKFLLSFPCMNSFSAQVMLTAAPLAKLLTMSIHELKSSCPWIPGSVLRAFYKTAQLHSILGEDSTHSPRSTESFNSSTVSAASAAFNDEPSSSYLETNRAVNSSWNGDRNHSYFQPDPVPQQSWANTPKSDGNASDDSLWQAIDKDNNIDVFTNRDFSMSYDRPSPCNVQFLKDIEFIDAQTDICAASYRRQDNMNTLSTTLRGGSPSFDRQQCNQDVFDDSWNIQTHQQNHLSQYVTFQNGQDYRDVLYSTIPQSDIQAQGIGMSRTCTAPLLQQRERTKALPQSGPIECVQRRYPEKYLYCETVSRRTDAPSLHSRSSDLTESRSYQTAIHPSLPGGESDRAVIVKDATPMTVHCIDRRRDDCFDSNGRLGMSLISVQGSKPCHLPQVAVPAYANQQSRGKRSIPLFHINRSRTGDQGIGSFRSQPSVNIGVAQPLRRTENPRQDGPIASTSTTHQRAQVGETATGRQVTKNERKQQGLPKFEDLFGTTHKRNQRAHKQHLKEHEVPSLEPSPDNSSDLSIFSSDDVSNKRRRLTYERVPGAKDGQTKLAFY